MKKFIFTVVLNDCNAVITASNKKEVVSKLKENGISVKLNQIFKQRAVI